jgi:hypothetical protein
MPHDQDLSRLPPAPRSLRSIKGARMELARLYAQTKRGEVDPGVAGKLSHILSILISSARDHALEERLAGIEERLAAAAKPNGHARPEARP